MATARGVYVRFLASVKHWARNITGLYGTVAAIGGANPRENAPTKLSTAGAPSFSPYRTKGHTRSIVYVDAMATAGPRGPLLIPGPTRAK
jgi:hypothetical protein